jgi:integrase
MTTKCRHFGEGRPIGSITPGDADAWRLWLLERLGENTVRRHCARAKQFFRAALRKRLIPENPFADMRDCNVRANRERDYFLPQDDARKVLDACPDTQWQLLFALSRYGGLRCPSEHLALTWQDIDWEHDRLTVHSPKTEHHEGTDSRVIPLFPELRPYLEAAFNETEDALGRPPAAAEHVITRYRDTNANLRTQLNRIIKRAGLEPWPKLFHNLRATRETELAAEYPAHVVAAWMGHSVLIANKHYLQVTDADFARAAGRGAKSGALRAGTAAQNPAQPMSAASRQRPPRNENANGSPDLRPTLANRGGLCSFHPVAGAGVEPTRP